MNVLKGVFGIAIWIAGILVISLFGALVSGTLGGLLLIALMHIEYVVAIGVIALIVIIAVANR